MAIRTKVSGTWKDVYKIFTKISGTWKEVTDLNTKVSSAWKTVGISLVSTNRILLLDANAYSGSGNWLDTSGSNNHGTLSNVNHVSSRDRAYFSMNEATRNGGNQYISLASGAINPNNSFTIGFWVRINPQQPHLDIANNVTTRTNTFISNLAANSALQLRDKTAGLEVVKSFAVSSAQNVFSNSALDDNEIYNIVFVRDNSTNPDTFKVFVNGTQTNPSTGSTIGTFTDNESTFVAPQILGRNYNPNNDNESLNGRFYHVVAYDTALSSTQILQNYNALKGRYVGDAACPLNLENLEVYLNTGITASLTGTNNTNLAQGTVWSDLSGQNNHFGFGTNSSTTTTPKYKTASGSFDIDRPTSITSNLVAAVYLASHYDLINAFGSTNIASAKQHWTDHGFNEGRQINFDVHAYLELNTDLRNFSNPAYYTDHQAAALHFAGLITTEDRAVVPKASIKPSLMGFGHLDIDGQAGHARSALNADFYKFSSTTDFSIGIWVYVDSWSTGDGIYSCGAYEHGGSFELRETFAGGNRKFQLMRNLIITTTNYQFAAVTSAAVDDDMWHYVMVTCDRNVAITMYVDGIQTGTNTNSIFKGFQYGELKESGSNSTDVSATDVDNVFRIGTNRAENDHFNGRIGQFHLWKGKALDRQEVLAAYNETKHKYGHPNNLYRNG